MFRSYLKIAWRNLARNKGFSVLNIAGLAIGMASAMLILMWVNSELRYDAFYKNSDRLYMAWNRSKGNEGINCWNVTPKVLGPALKKDYPEVEKATRVNWDEAYLMTVGEKKINLTGAMVDPDFLTMFDMDFLKGDINTALNEPYNIVITQKMSRKLFDDADPMNKMINVDNKYNFKVAGVIRDLPNNTQFDFEYLMPASFMHTTNQDDSSWGKNSIHNFVLLRPNTDINAFNAKIRNILIDHGDKSWTVQSFLYPVSKLRLYSHFENGIPAGGKIETVRVFIVIAVLLLLIACINFMNMSTARSEKRAREVGIRKVSGAGRGSLLAQFLGESILVAIIAGLFALVLLQLSFGPFNALTGKDLSIPSTNAGFWLLFTGFILVTGLLAGSYPAFFLSSFRPVSVLKGALQKGNALVTPRKVLVVVQFTFAIVLIVSTLIIKQQLQYGRDRETGYDRNNVTYTFLSGDIARNYELIRHELLNNGIAQSVTKTSAPLTEGWSSGGAEWDGKPANDKTEFNYFNEDGDLAKTAGFTVVQGRDIDVHNYPGDSTAVVLNEAAVKAMGFKDPIGKLINKGDGFAGWHIVGVIRNFILQSPYDPVKPLIVQGLRSNWYNMVHVKLSSARSTAANLAAMSEIFRKYNPQYPFEYHFIDEQYAKKFSDEQTTAKLTALFAGLTIFISCLGLFGLAAYMAESRIKEIGVRKVLGASVASIATLLSKDFIRLVVIAILIATPIAWWAMHKWLEKYPYRIPMSAWIFVAAGLSAVLIALLTVSFQSVRAALANPVKSLRSE